MQGNGRVENITIRTNQTEGSNLGGKGRGSTDLSSDATQAHDSDLVGVKLGRHPTFCQRRSEQRNRYEIGL